MIMLNRMLRAAEGAERVVGLMAGFFGGWRRIPDCTGADPGARVSRASRRRHVPVTIGEFTGTTLGTPGGLR